MNVKIKYLENSEPSFGFSNASMPTCFSCISPVPLHLHRLRLPAISKSPILLPALQGAPNLERAFPCSGSAFPCQDRVEDPIWSEVMRAILPAQQRRGHPAVGLAVLAGAP